MQLARRCGRQPRRRRAREARQRHLRVRGRAFERRLKLVTTGSTPPDVHRAGRPREVALRGRGTPSRGRVRARGRRGQRLADGRAVRGSRALARRARTSRPSARRWERHPPRRRAHPTTKKKTTRTGVGSSSPRRSARCRASRSSCVCSSHRPAPPRTKTQPSRSKESVVELKHASSPPNPPTVGGPRPPTRFAVRRAF